eukprot:scaffold6927_cov93-Cylindrotheca_fusiformis.AAC.3
MESQATPSDNILVQLIKLASAQASTEDNSTLMNLIRQLSQFVAESSQQLSANENNFPMHTLNAQPQSSSLSSISNGTPPATSNNHATNSLIHQSRVPSSAHFSSPDPSSVVSTMNSTTTQPSTATSVSSIPTTSGGTSASSSIAASFHPTALDANVLQSSDPFIVQAYLEIMAKRTMEDATAGGHATGNGKLEDDSEASKKPKAKRSLEETEDEGESDLDDTIISHRTDKKRRTSRDYEAPATLDPRQSTYDKKWDDHYNQLVAFKEEHGHCRVPQKYEPNGALSQWVKRQRYHRKCKPRYISESRIRKLDDLGFVWDAQDQLWQTRFEELKAYKLKHGNCNVPYKYEGNQKLGTWVKCQRRQFKLLQQGQSSNLTSERISLLQGLGFEMNPSDRSRS